MNRMMMQHDADTMQDVGIFMTTVAHLVSDDNTEKCTDGAGTLNGFTLDGLMRGLKLIGHQLCCRSEQITEMVEKEKEEEEMTKAARQRRQGQDTNRQSNVEGKCGTQRAA